MHVLTGATMREADRRTIEDVGIPGRVLMESAGRGIVREMKEHIPELEDRVIAIVCGKGNNGGDGLVVLRTLLELGYDARAWVLSPFERLSPDAIANLQAALKLSLPVEAVADEAAWEEALPQIASADVIVDAILGTGLTQAAHGLAARAIEDLSALDGLKVAVDVPSGLSSDSGNIAGPHLEAHLTVALAAPKICHYFAPASDRCGEVSIVQIGIPERLLQSGSPKLETIEPDDVIGTWPSRKRSAHKGDFGHLLVVAGSVGKTGAALMSAKAALRSGAGLVTVASAKSAIPMMAPALPEVMWEPLPETDSGAIAHSARSRIEELLERRSALALGPGLGLHEETVRLVRELTRGLRLPTIIDADGLNALQENIDSIPRDGSIGLTPHPGEAGRLLGCSAADVQRDRLQAVRELSKRTTAHVLLKGHRSLVADPEGNVGINLTGNAGMATAGSGDVLTGIIGGLLAQGAEIADALTAAVYVHGCAGDLAASELGEISLVATDLIANLPKALRALAGC
jgi:hydroxyethylthiazole kinase-like uncharacterized protein yjeF